MKLRARTGPFTFDDFCQLVQEDQKADLINGIIYIVSPDSVERDYVLKRAKYEQARVREYWIIDEFEQKVILLRLGTDGKYRGIRARRGELRSQVLHGFWLRPEWLWQRPLPMKLDI